LLVWYPLTSTELALAVQSEDRRIKEVNAKESDAIIMNVMLLVRLPIEGLVEPIGGEVD